ncbi:MAG: GTP-binding protein, partial [Pseudomonadota bacterium]
HDLVTHSTDDAVIQMSSGCLCCTFRTDLAKTLRQAPGRFARRGQLWFDRVVIETTGLADPAPILHTLMSDPALEARYCLDGVITTVDAVSGSDTLDRHLESVKQVAMADRLLLTKSDISNRDVLTGLQERLRALNPAAAQIVTENGVVDPALLFGVGIYDPKSKSLDVQDWLKAEAYDQLQDRHDAKIKSFCLTLDNPISGDALDAWLESLHRFRGEDLLRIKGIFNVAGLDGPVVMHGVQHTFHTPITLNQWPSEDRRSRIVFITRDIDESELRETLDALTGKVAIHKV